MKNEKGSALVLAIIIMALLSAVIIGLSRNSEIDLFIGRNVRILKQAFLWGDSGLDFTEELISISEYERGDTDVTTTYTFDDSTIQVSYSNQIYNSSTSTVYFLENGVNATTVRINYLGSITSDGTSIIFAAGYEGVGKGLGAGGSIARIYELHSTGYSESDSIKRSAEIYRSLSSGK